MNDKLRKVFFADNYGMKNNFTLFALALGLFLFFSGVLAAAEAPSARPANVILEEITFLLGNFQFDEAIALFDTMDPQEAANSRNRLHKASVLISAGKTGEARIIVEEVSRSEPGNLDALFILSTIEAASGRTRERQAVLERIVASDPQNINALLELASLHFYTRSIDNSITYYDQVLEIDPGNLNALLGRAEIHRLHRDPYAAEILLNSAVSLHPNQAAPFRERAQLYRGAGFLVQALEDLDRAKELDINDYDIALDRGLTLNDLFRREEALEDFERAAVLWPSDFRAYVFIAGIKDILGDLDGAERAYEIVTTLNPAYFYAFEGLGLHKMRKGQWLEARDAFAEAYIRAPDEYLYALLTAASYMRHNIAGPRQFLNQAMTNMVRRDISRQESIEFLMLRLFHEATNRSFNGEDNMLARIERETDQATRSRMTFFMGLYNDIRGLTNTANRFYQQVRDMNQRYLPEWRLNEWILSDRGIEPPF